MDRRAALIALLAAAAPRGAAGQAPRATHRVVIIEQWFATASSTPARNLVAELAASGFTTANTAIEWRYPGGDAALLTRHATEAAASRPDAIVSMGTFSTRAVMKATSVVPVLAWVDDPVKEGLARPSLSPLRNATGFVDLGAERIMKSLELLKTWLPGFDRFGVLRPHGNADVESIMADLAPRARNLGVRVVQAELRAREDIERAMGDFEREGVRAALAWPAPKLMSLRETVELALSHRIALVSEGLAARAGVLLAFSPDVDAKRLAVQLVKILRGIPVADIPFEMPARYILAINRKTARALQLPIPDDVYLRADHVFDEWQ
jgi:putative ABC transport system substrate-binding protein